MLTIKFRQNYALLVPHTVTITIPIVKSRFSERQTGTGRTLGYLYQHSEILLNPKFSYCLEIWLKLPDGREIYQIIEKGLTV
jgi:Rad3-related DNA helicase